MKAARIQNYGGPDAIEIEIIETPTPIAGQVQVEVHASSLNPFDTVVREGYMKEMIPLTFPVTLGGDIAGIVTALGADVDSLAIGDKVYGQANVVAGNSGALAEFAVTAAGQLARTPSNVDPQQAASLPLVGASAIQALTEHLGLKSGQKLFIHGGAGAIGSIAVELAKHLGAYVATTATGEGVELAKHLGADEVIDYKTEDFTAKLSDYDAVFDTVGGDDFARALDILKKGGKAVSMIAQPDEAKATELGVTAIMQQTKVDTATLGTLSKFVEVGVISPRIGKTFSLDEIQEAFKARESGGVLGKVVIEIA